MNRKNVMSEKEIMTIQRAKELAQQDPPHYLCGFRLADVKKAIPGIIPFLDINHLKYCGVIRLNRKGEELIIKNLSAPSQEPSKHRK